jgi:hypothetical protein
LIDKANRLGDVCAVTMAARRLMAANQQMALALFVLNQQTAERDGCA